MMKKITFWNELEKKHKEMHISRTLNYNLYALITVVRYIIDGI